MLNVNEKLEALSILRLNACQLFLFNYVALPVCASYSSRLIIISSFGIILSSGTRYSREMGWAG